jgi:hypothetical protein
MLGTTEPPEKKTEREAAEPASAQAVSTPKPQTGSTSKPQALKKENRPVVNTAEIWREKTSFALRPEVKRRLTLLKLDLRAAGHRVTEAEIVETLIAQASADGLAAMLGGASHRRRRSK